MKTLFTSIFILTLLISCKNDTKTAQPETSHASETLKTKKTYPQSISKIFEKHGGLKTWNTMKTLEFSMNKPNGIEKTITNLKSREAVITTPDYDLGYDGKDVWLLNRTQNEVKSKPKFYYNLMFYFYTMPFVLAATGIVFEDVEPLQFNDTSYPGIKISYESEIGNSSEDQYIIYYNSETFQMEWLAYTVTYFSKSKSESFNFIRYNDWKNYNGLLLPKSITWYNAENNIPTTSKKVVQFENVKLSNTGYEASIFAKPNEATIVN